MRAKKFKTYTESGLGISKTGKIQVPYIRDPADCNDPLKNTINVYRQPIAKVGDRVADVSHAGFITKNSLAVVMEEDKILNGSRVVKIKYFFGNKDGTERWEAVWARDLFVMTGEQHDECFLKYLLDK